MGCASDGRPLHTSYHLETRQFASPRSQPVAVEGPVCRRSLISIEHRFGLWVVSLVLMIMAMAPPRFPCQKVTPEGGEMVLCSTDIAPETAPGVPLVSPSPLRFDPREYRSGHRGFLLRWRHRISSSIWLPLSRCRRLHGLKIIPGKATNNLM
jgi:hypothetical protein